MTLLECQLIVTKSAQRITQGLYGCWVNLSLVCSGTVCLGCCWVQENSPQGWGPRGLQWPFPLWILWCLITAEHMLQPFVQLRLLITSLSFTWMSIFANLWGTESSLRLLSLCQIWLKLLNEFKVVEGDTDSVNVWAIGNQTDRLKWETL